jgi:hypothetical protein
LSVSKDEKEGLVEELLIALVQGFFQLMEIFFDPPFIFWDTSYATNEDASFWIGSIVFLAGAGVISLHCWHDVVLRKSSVRILALLFSPIFSGWVSRQLGKVLSSAQTNSFFWLAFLFNLGICLIRFAYCHRPA